MSIDTTKLEQIINASKKSYGVAFHKASEYPQILRIPTHSVELNIATGGGVPIGRFSRLWGEESSGKSLNCLQIAKNAQNIHLIAQEMLNSEFDAVKVRGEEILKRFPDGMKVCWYDVEGSFDKDFALDIGVNIEELELFPDNRIEVVGEVMEAALGAAHLHIVDSTGDAASVDELKEKIGSWQRGLKARVWNKVIDRLKTKIDNEQNAVIFIDQVRVDQNTGKYIVPGGKRMSHESSLTINTKRGKHLYLRDGELSDVYPQKSDTLSESVEADAIEFMAHVTKSRVGTSQRRARMRYELKSRKFDSLYELAKVSIYLGIVKQAASWYELPNGEKVQGEKGLKNVIAQDEQLKHKILDSVNLYCIENV